MKTIQTKPGVTLGFINSPLHVENLRYDKSGHFFLYEDKGTNITCRKFLESAIGKYEYIGNLSEITEEQAKELVEIREGKYWFYKMGYSFNLTPMDIDSTLTCKKGLTAIASWLKIPESEFNNYLVVKL